MSGLVAGVLGMALMLAGAWRGRRGAKLCGAVLVLYALWELPMGAWRSPDGEAALRVDLPFVLPIVIVAALAGVWNLFARPLPPEAPEEAAAERDPPAEDASAEPRDK